MRFISSVSNVWECIKQRKGLTAGTVILDGVFLYLFFGFTSIQWLRIMEQTRTLMEVLAAESPQLEAGTEAAMKVLLAQSGAMKTEVMVIMKSIGWYVIGSLLLWCLLEGIVWWICHRVEGNKQKLPNFLKWFSVKSICALFAFAAMLFLVAQASISLVIAKTSLISQESLNLFAKMGFVALAFLAVVSYATHGKKWIANYRRNLENVNTWLAGVTVAGIFFGLFRFIVYAQNYWISLAGMLLVVIAFTIAKLYVIEVVK